MELVAQLVGLLAGFVERGSYGRWWDIGGVAVSWISQIQIQWWIAADLEMAVVAFVAVAGAAGLIVAQRTIFPHVVRARRTP